MPSIDLDETWKQERKKKKKKAGVEVMTAVAVVMVVMAEMRHRWLELKHLAEHHPRKLNRRSIQGTRR